MTLIRRLALVLTMIFTVPAAAVSIAPAMIHAHASTSYLWVRSQDIPDVVRLLVQRAARAERRGDFETADELYRAIRELGYDARRSRREYDEYDDYVDYDDERDDDYDD